MTVPAADCSSIVGNASGIRACVFDAYGTLFDVHSSITRSSGDIPKDQATQLSRLWRQKQLQYTWLRTIQGRHADFWQITADSLDYSLNALCIATPALRDRLLAKYLRLDVFPDVPAMLRRIRSAGLKTAILSNGTSKMLSMVVKNAGLRDTIDMVLSAEEVRVYKPHPDVYQLAVERLGMAASAIAFQSANGWDAHAAAAFGMQVVWCNRDGEPRERLPGLPHLEIASLADLPGLLGA